MLELPKNYWSFQWHKYLFQSFAVRMLLQSIIQGQKKERKKRKTGLINLRNVVLQSYSRLI